MTDFVDMALLPKVLHELSHAAKEQKLHAKTTSTQLTAFKREFDESVRGTMMKMEDLEQDCLDMKKTVSDQVHNLTKVTNQLQKAELVGDRLQEVTRKVQLVDGKLSLVERSVMDAGEQIQECLAVRDNVDVVKQEVQAIQRRADAFELVNSSVSKCVGDLQEQVRDENASIAGLKEEIAIEVASRSGEGEAILGNISQVRTEIAQVFRGLGGASLHKGMDFSDLMDTKSEGLLDRFAMQIRDLEEGAGVFKGEIRRVDALSGQLLKLEKEVESMASQMSSLISLQSEMSAKLSSILQWRQAVQETMKQERELAEQKPAQMELKARQRGQSQGNELSFDSSSELDSAIPAKPAAAVSKKATALNQKHGKLEKSRQTTQPEHIDPSQLEQMRSQISQLDDLKTRLSLLQTRMDNIEQAQEQQSTPFATNLVSIRASAEAHCTDDGSLQQESGLIKPGPSSIRPLSGGRKRGKTVNVSAKAVEHQTSPTPPLATGAAEVQGGDGKASSAAERKPNDPPATESDQEGPGSPDHAVVAMYDGNEVDAEPLARNVSSASSASIKPQLSPPPEWPAASPRKPGADSCRSTRSLSFDASPSSPTDRRPPYEVESAAQYASFRSAPSVESANSASVARPLGSTKRSSPYRHRTGSVASAVSSSSSPVPDFSAVPEEAFALLYQEVGLLRQSMRKHLGSARLPPRPQTTSGLPWEKARQGVLAGVLSARQDGGAVDGGETSPNVNSGMTHVGWEEVDRFVRDALYMLRRELGMLRDDVAGFKLRASSDPVMATAIKALETAERAEAKAERLGREGGEDKESWEHRYELLKARVEQVRSEAASNARRAREEARREETAGRDGQLQRLEVQLSSLRLEIDDRLEVLGREGAERGRRLGRTEAAARECVAAMDACHRRIGSLETLAAKRAVASKALEEQETLRHAYAYHLDFTPLEGLAPFVHREGCADQIARAQQLESGAETERRPVRPDSARTGIGQGRGRGARPQSARVSRPAHSLRTTGPDSHLALAAPRSGPPAMNLIPQAAQLSSVGRLDLSLRRLEGGHAHARARATGLAVAGPERPGHHADSGELELRGRHDGHWHSDGASGASSEASTPNRYRDHQLEARALAGRPGSGLPVGQHVSGGARHVSRSTVRSEDSGSALYQLTTAPGRPVEIDLILQPHQVPSRTGSGGHRTMAGATSERAVL